MPDINFVCVEGRIVSVGRMAHGMSFNIAVNDTFGRCRLGPEMIDEYDRPGSWLKKAVIGKHVIISGKIIDDVGFTVIEAKKVTVVNA